VVASKYTKVALGIGKLALLDILDPRPVDPERDIMFFLAGDRAGMTANAPVLVDDKSVAHLLSLPQSVMTPVRYFSL
jgi:hypothetical protein